MKLSTKVMMGLGGIAVVLYGLNALITPSLVGPARLEAHYRPRLDGKFDSNVWKEDGFVGANGRVRSDLYGKRYAMVDDLLSSRALLGLDEPQVTALLGDPDAGLLDQETIKFYGNSDTTKKIRESSEHLKYWSYHLAPKYKFPARSIWFPLSFGSSDSWILSVEMKNGKVCSTTVH